MNTGLAIFGYTSKYNITGYLSTCSIIAYPGTYNTIYTTAFNTTGFAGVLL